MNPIQNEGIEMKIAKNSWHYRLMLKMYEHDWQIPTDLCRYVRSLLWRAFWLLVAGVVLAVLACVVLFVLIVAPLAVFVYLYTGMPELEWAREGGLTVWTGYGALFCIYLFVRTKMIAEDKLRARARARTGAGLPPPEPNIFVQRYRDWRNKVCTQLEFH